MQWSTEDRQRFLGSLDRMEQALTAVYRGLLWLVVAAVLAVAAYGAVYRPWGEGHQGEGFYFSVAVLLVLGWAVGQFVWLGRRRTRRQAGQHVPWTVRSNSEDGVFTWKFQIGSSADDPRNDSSEGAGGFRSAPFSDDPRTE